MHVDNARLNARRVSLTRAGYSCGLALLVFLLGSKALQNAVAEGDTRTISMHHLHTGENITITYKRDGRHDEAALEKLNWFLRDWRRNQDTHMDPHLIDLVWDVQREGAPNTPIQVVCGYRAPETNAMLRHRSASSGVARFSQHTLGRAMDFYIPGVPLERLREIGLRMQRGGVGFYPESGSPFVHMDTGGIRMWPRMTREQLARVFPDGRTVHIPSDGKPLPGYALALADAEKRGSTPSQNSLDAARIAGVNVDTLLARNDRPATNPFARLFGLAKDEDDDDDAANAATPAVAAVPSPSKHSVLAALEHDARIGAEVAAATGKATAKVAVRVADAAAKVKLISTAEAAPALVAAPPQAAVQTQAAASAQTTTPRPTAGAALTPNQVISARGYWEGPAAGMAAANPTAAASLQRAAVATASKAPAAPASSAADFTGSFGPFADPRATDDMALGYADQPTRHAMGIAALRAAAMPVQAMPVQAMPPRALPAQPPVPPGTTIAVKRAPNQAASAVMTASTSPLTVVNATDAHFRNPWLRAIVLSPSVHRFLTTAALGARDFRSLAGLMVKPANAVNMTFSADPNPGLDHEHFSGSAIVFVSTVTYPTRTAALQ